MAQLTASLTLPSFVPTALFTRHGFQQAADDGLLNDTRHLELIEGKAIRKLAQNGPHATAAQLVEDSLRHALPVGYLLRVEKPLAIDNLSQPEPDVAVVRGATRDFELDHPTTAERVVEIADSSLFGDRGLKAGLYASAGIREYWILNLRDRTLELYRTPAPNSTARFGARYQQLQTVSSYEMVSPLFAPNVRLVVDDLLPSLRLP